MILTPTLHKPVPMGTKVVLPKNYLGEGVTGEVAGVATAYVVFTYIVILDKPIFHEGEWWKAIAVLGSELRGVDGEDWRLTEPPPVQGV